MDKQGAQVEQRFDKILAMHPAKNLIDVMIWKGGTHDQKC